MSEIIGLAQRLAANHIKNSDTNTSSSRITSRLLNILEDDAKNYAKTYKQERNIVVIVGSGASKSAGVKMGNEAITDLLSYFDNNYIRETTIKQECKRLADLHSMPDDEFETRLMALGRFPHLKDILTSELKKIYAHKYPSVFTYELLAHYLKHRFIDAIINFNFDELLDQSIKDELGSGKYFHILSDGDCNNLITQTFPYSKPVYVKPHGTASYPSSLRYTHEDYIGISINIQELLSKMLLEKPVTLIVIGFSMKSPELNKILKKITSDLEIFYIDPNPPQPNLRTLLIHTIKIKNSLDKEMKKLWVVLNKQFKKDHKPRGIRRHLLVSQLFQQKVDDINNKTDTYLRNRIFTEISLSIAKSKGLIDINTLATERAGEYFNEYKKYQHHETLIKFCEECNTKSISYSDEVLKYGGFGRNGTLKKDEFDSEELINDVKANLSNKGDLTRVTYNLFKKTLEEQFIQTEVEIESHIDPSLETFFRSSKHLPTHAALQYQTRKLLSEEYRTLLVIAETGQWLTEKPILDIFDEKNKKPRIALIVADDSWEDDIRKKYERNMSYDIKIIQMRWWEHNRHMTMTLNKNESVKKCIFFFRRNRDPKICPILIENAPDSQKIKKSFLAYWQKALNKPNWLDNNLPGLNSIF